MGTKMIFGGVHNMGHSICMCTQVHGMIEPLEQETASILFLDFMYDSCGKKL
jgi:hypothetical protein